jgi:hypothetical protein
MSERMVVDEAHQHSWETLLPPHWRQTVQVWLDEDVPSFDIGGFVVGGEVGAACWARNGAPMSL